jgi:CBS domain-containing protein
MQVREGMSKRVLTVGPDHTLRQAASQMAERGVGAAVVIDPDGMGPGILTVRDIVRVWTDDGASCDLPQPPDLARAG